MRITVNENNVPLRQDSCPLFLHRKETMPAHAVPIDIKEQAISRLLAPAL